MPVCVCVCESLNTDIKFLGDVISSEKFLSFQIATANLSSNIYCILTCVNTTSAIIDWHFQKLTRSHCQATWRLCVYESLNTGIKSFVDMISSEIFPSFQITTAKLSGNIYCILACVNTTSAIIDWHYQKLTRSHPK